MNGAMRRIIGIQEFTLPKAPCSRWHGFTWYPCEQCLVKETFHDGQPHSDVFLSPLVGRKDRDLTFMKVWSQLVTGPQVPLGIDGKPMRLAVMESVLELTDTPELKAMPLGDRLDVIARALFYTREKEYLSKHRFEHVRIFIVDRTGTETFVLRAAAGSRQPSELGMPVNLREVDGDKLNHAEDQMKKTGTGCCFGDTGGLFDPVQPSEARVPFIYWPIIAEGTTVAIMEVGGCLINNDIVETIRPYATEVLHAIEDDRSRTPASQPFAEAGRSVGEVDLALQSMPRSAEGQLKEIVRRACQLTDSHQYVIRHRQGDNAELLKLGIPDFCAYEDVAAVSNPLSYVESWSCRTILAGTETIANIAKQQDLISAFRAKLGQGAQ